MKTKLTEADILSIPEKTDSIFWERLCQTKILPVEFIREFVDRVDWDGISKCQKLSEDFIREFADRVSWFKISKHQKLSEEFILEFAGRVDWYEIAWSQELSDDFIQKFSDMINTNYVMDSYYQKSTEEKKQLVMDTNLYECHDDHFIAFKAIRRDRWSNFNFHYQYLPGETYEAHCDHSMDENSFGLSAWTYDGAHSHYSDGLIVRVKVFYQDIGRIVHSSNKVRCTRITILD